MSLDGKISQSADSGPTFTSRFDRRKLFRLRSEADLLLVGAQTVRVEQLPPLIRSQEFILNRKNLGKPEQPALAIVSESLDLPWDSDFFKQTPRPLFLVTGKASLEARALAENLALGLLETGERLNLKAGLHQLFNLGFRRILCEGGGQLVSSLLRENIAEELFLTIAPVLIGGRTTPTLTVGETFQPPPHFNLHDCHIEGSELHLWYQRMDSSHQTTSQDANHGISRK